MKSMRISENLGDFPGVDATVDWERNYVNGNLFRSILGNIRVVKKDYRKKI